MRGMLFGCIFFCATLGVAAEPKATSEVEVKMVLATNAVHPDSLVKAAVVAQVAPGYHINDHHPSLDYLIPTELKLEGSEQISVEKIAYPKGKPEKFAFSETPLSVYEGTVLVGTVLKIGRKVRQGPYTIRGKFSYQACNDHACLPPSSLPVVLTLKVVLPRVPLKRQNTEVFKRVELE